MAPTCQAEKWTDIRTVTMRKVVLPSRSGRITVNMRVKRKINGETNRQTDTQTVRKTNNRLIFAIEYKKIWNL